MASMTAMKNYHAVAVFQRLYAVQAVHQCDVWCTLHIDRKQNVQCNYVFCPVVAVIAEFFGQWKVVCFVDVTLKAI